MRRTAWLAAAALALAGCRPSTVWSPDGKQIAVEASGGLYLFDTGTEKFRRLNTGAARPVNPVWSPDGRRLAYYLVASQQGKGTRVSLAVLEVAAGAQRILVPRLSVLEEQGRPVGLEGDLVATLVKEFGAVQWSPNGRQIAYVASAGKNSAVWIVSAAGGPPRRLTSPTRSALAPAWSPDGKRLAYLSLTQAPRPGPQGPDGAAWKGEASLHVIHIDGTGVRRLWAPAGDTVLSPFAPGPQWSPDGQRIGVFTETPSEKSPIGETCQAWTVPLAGGEAQKLADVPGPSPFASLTPDLKSILFFHGVDAEVPTVALLAEPYEKPRRFFKVEVPGTRPPGGSTEIESFPVPTLSPDGRRIAVLLAEKGKPAQLLLGGTDGSPAKAFAVPARPR